MTTSYEIDYSSYCIGHSSSIVSGNIISNNINKPLSLLSIASG